MDALRPNDRQGLFKTKVVLLQALETLVQVSFLCLRLTKSSLECTDFVALFSHSAFVAFLDLVDFFGESRVGFEDFSQGFSASVKSCLAVRVERLTEGR